MARDGMNFQPGDRVFVELIGSVSKPRPGGKVGTILWEMEPRAGKRTFAVKFGPRSRGVFFATRIHYEDRSFENARGNPSKKHAWVSVGTVSYDRGKFAVDKLYRQGFLSRAVRVSRALFGGRRTLLVQIVERPGYGVAAARNSVGSVLDS